MTEATQSTDEVTIEILMHGEPTRDSDPIEEGSERFEIARDLMTFGPEVFEKTDNTVEYAIETGFETIGDPVTINADALEGADEPLRLAENVYRTCQGPTKPDLLPYDGEHVRSMSVGDIVVIDGTAYMAAKFGFEEIGQIDELRSD